ncbi:proto-oncogene tyrosine-protein kinase receptor Ret-like isoform X2 [Acanthaster planci]|uniref:receptor protein-tyrosine kinase n=1 Tax=Acanthaster planci TaxID=133434 RepID=A0A8B7Z8V7_ACAPL|nr:proto-oncogene tyrosine-protein kinase receptor Ret-like isoform X2 [Acanthaster planci]
MASLLRTLVTVLPFIAVARGACSNDWCLNGGACQDAPPGCICPEGFVGFYCEIEVTGEEVCEPPLCMNGGRCIADLPTCECNDGYSGFLCEVENCQTNADCNGGMCRNGTGEEINECANCPAGMSGPHCDTPFGELCGRVDGICLNDAACVPRPTGSGFTCMCPENYVGPVCEIYSICSGINPCRNGGTCVSGNCQCVNPFSGILCERSCTNDDQCMNEGTCTLSGVCECLDGFRGSRCGVAECSDTNPCLNQGTCMDGSCTCSAPFFGNLCEKIDCSNTNPCLNGGACEMDACSCVAPYTGNLCQRGCSSSSQCLNGGTCTDMMVCMCAEGFGGPRCGAEAAEMCRGDNDCLHSGRCNENGVCECVSNFQGTFCEIACTVDSQCMNGGRCGTSGVCDCVAGFMGARCQDAATNITVIVIVVVLVVIILLLVVIVALLLLRRRLAMKRRRKSGVGGELELGNRNVRRSNDYIGVDNGKEPPVARRPNSMTYEPDGKPKEFPRERLHVMEQLGAGSFATVHRAEADGIVKKGVMTTVAVKMLKTTATEGDKRDFEKERSMYLNLGTHPNVVTMLGFCTEKEPFFLIMEYLPNGNLQTYLRHIRTGAKEQYFSLKEIREEKRNYLLPAEILSFAMQIASGMEFLASKSCIHRDLATRNILLGEDLVAKVSDFGLARDVQDSSSYEMKSHGRVPVRWMAPESLLDNIYTTKSDVWGFAVMLWELVTLGSHPYPGMSSKQVIDKITTGYRLPKPESCSDEIYDMLKQCWNDKPEDRPTFTEIRKLLDNMLADASGYLVMADLNRDDYLYLEPNQTKSVNTADDF